MYLVTLRGATSGKNVIFCCSIYVPSLVIFSAKNSSETDTAAPRRLVVFFFIPVSHFQASLLGYNNLSDIFSQRWRRWFLSICVN